MLPGDRTAIEFQSWCGNPQHGAPLTDLVPPVVEQCCQKNLECEVR